jgi:hypothetical protein
MDQQNDEEQTMPREVRPRIVRPATPEEKEQAGTLIRANSR